MFYFTAPIMPSADVGYIRPLEVRRDSVILGWGIPPLIPFDRIEAVEIPPVRAPLRRLPHKTKAISKCTHTRIQVIK